MLTIKNIVFTYLLSVDVVRSFNYSGKIVEATCVLWAASSARQALASLALRSLSLPTGAVSAASSYDMEG